MFLSLRHYTAESAAGFEVDKKTLRVSYMRGWFPIDFFSVLPFDVFSVAMNSSSLGDLRVLRILKLMR